VEVSNVRGLFGPVQGRDERVISSGQGLWLHRRLGKTLARARRSFDWQGAQSSHFLDAMTVLVLPQTPFLMQEFVFKDFRMNRCPITRRSLVFGKSK
jgi:hypothetical protein